MKSYKHHLEYYLPLLVIFIAGFFVISLFEEKNMKMIALVIIGFFYGIWGILHHYSKHDLTLKIMVEYFLVAMLGIAILFFALKGGFNI